MGQELERPGVTELHVRMNCNGCVNRVKKALHSVEGIYEVQVDFPQQKVTVIGRAAPEKMLKAIKKTRKIATICSHTEPGDPEQAPPAEPAPAASDDPPAPPVASATDQPPAEAPAVPPTEQRQEPPAAPQEATAGEVKSSPEAADDSAAPAAAADKPAEPASEDKDVGEVHTIKDHHHPHRRVYQDHYWEDYRPYGGGYGRGWQHEVPYISTVTHSYSKHRPVTRVPEYGHLQQPPQSFRYTVVEPYIYTDVDYHRSGQGNNITTMFSDENPNACAIA